MEILTPKWAENEQKGAKHCLSLYVPTITQKIKPAPVENFTSPVKNVPSPVENAPDIYSPVNFTKLPYFPGGYWWPTGALGQGVEKICLSE